MYIFNKLEVIPTLPSKINRLEEITYNIWWTWNTNFLKLFKMIDEVVWDQAKKNPVKFLKLISQEKLEEATKNEEFMKQYEEIVFLFDEYMNEKETTFSNKYKKHTKDTFAYFSAEYGLDETIPIYSGGLGVLSGDHMKTASDIGIPYVGIGLLYKEGYFEQKIDGNGSQITKYTKTDLETLPIVPVKDKEEKELRVFVNILNEKVYAKVWQINVGRVKLYLLDTDVPENSEKARSLTARLYGGDQEMRISQEIVLGFGGLKVLKELNIKPKLYHMNEGHSAFLLLKLIEEIIEEKNVSFDIASEMVKIETIFTTHTAVPAGTDIFPREMMKRYFDGFNEKIKLSEDEFLNLGSSNLDGEYPPFNMTKFAIKLSGKRNGVSKLHSAVSKELFKEMWPNIMDEEIPIGYVTNGVHVGTWMSPDMHRLFEKYLESSWNLTMEDEYKLNKIKDIPNEELWQTHKELKKKMLRVVKKRNKERLIRNGVPFEIIKEIDEKLSLDVLTIGFGRRFATYKRATMIFSDLERLSEIVNDEIRPVQIIFSGKAHPADVEGQDLIRRINEISMMPQFRGKIILIEDYNMAISRFLVSGCDVWLNNPRRPMEASGTSGQKAAINGVLNFSTLDGWWEEGYNLKNGWKIGNRDIYISKDAQDKYDSGDLYNTLENEIIPMYYNKDEKVPVKWIEYMKESIKTSLYMFSSFRMFKDYIERMYFPALDIKEKGFNNLEKIEKLVEWKKFVRSEWENIKIKQNNDNIPKKIKAGEELDARCLIDFGNIKKEDADVELFVAKINKDGEFKKLKAIKMKPTGKTEENYIEYMVKFIPEEGGKLGYTYRVCPKNDMIIEREDIKVVKWFTN